MRKITLGRTNQTVSAISLGTWSFGGANMSGKIPVGWADQSETESKSVLKRSWEVGINHWDTADVYGDGKSESIIGEMWTEVPRNDIFLATKLGWDRGPYPEWFNPKHMIKNFERSLKNLKSDFVDLIYLHHCNFGKNDEHFDDALNTLLKFKQEGRVKFIGLSDWSSKRIMKYIKECNPDVVQPYRNVQDDDYQSSGLKDYINKNNLGVCFFSPIKHGLLTGKYDTPPTFEVGDHRNNIKGFKAQEVLDKMKKNKRLLDSYFSEFQNPVLHGIIGALFNDSPTGCVLLGQRNIPQVDIASSLGEKLSRKDSDWVKSIYA